MLIGSLVVENQRQGEDIQKLAGMINELRVAVENASAVDNSEESVAS